MSEPEACRWCEDPIIFASEPGGRRVALEAPPDPGGEYVMVGPGRVLDCRGPGALAVIMAAADRGDHLPPDARYRQHRCEQMTRAAR